MGQGVIVAILSFLFYLTSLLGGNMGQTVQPVPQIQPTEQQSYFVLGQIGQFVTDMTLRGAPQNEATPITAARAKQAATILDQTPGWYKIRLESGLEGWVPQYSLSISQAQPRDSNKLVVGLYPNDDLAYDSLLKNSSQLTMVSPLGWQLNSYGELVANFDPEKMGKSLYLAGNQQLETYAHLEIPQKPSRLLTNTYLQEQSNLKIIQTLQDWGLKGLLLDFNYTPSEEQAQLIEFINGLGVALKNHDFGLYMVLPWDETLDYPGLTENIDYLILKTKPEKATPGPMQSVANLSEILANITKQVDPSKIILTLTTGGLDWPRSGPPISLSHERVLELAATEGAAIKWNSKEQAPYFKYGAGHEVWFENRYSVKPKIDLAKTHKLAGVALQYLGLEDPEVWPLIKKFSVS